jgi:hypothetical protein
MSRRPRRSRTTFESGGRSPGRRFFALLPTPTDGQWRRRMHTRSPIRPRRTANTCVSRTGLCVPSSVCSVRRRGPLPAGPRALVPPRVTQRGDTRRRRRPEAAPQRATPPPGPAGHDHRGTQTPVSETQPQRKRSRCAVAELDQRRRRAACGESDCTRRPPNSAMVGLASQRAPERAIWAGGCVGEPGRERERGSPVLCSVALPADASLYTP